MGAAASIVVRLARRMGAILGAAVGKAWTILATLERVVTTATATTTTSTIETGAPGDRHVCSPPLVIVAHITIRRKTTSVAVLQRSMARAVATDWCSSLHTVNTFSYGTDTQNKYVPSCGTALRKKEKKTDSIDAKVRQCPDFFCLTPLCLVVKQTMVPFVHNFELINDVT